MSTKLACRTAAVGGCCCLSLSFGVFALTVCKLLCRVFEIGDNLRIWDFLPAGWFAQYKGINGLTVPL